ncbi:precorrin-3B synthase [Pandoraea captiosa]|uniref:Precorrin-3B synthase n=1 Tax=Pandoraea captiosa TaxID=2508302 RepID=A0A5E5AFN9_9BURK|nr:precorrin-3B synthase [Pandoraea captiosa]VVE71926.1 precorrin-3B synthase [Pandoraea captiosa]
MASRDGGLCRVKLPGGKLSATQAVAIANAAETFASGTIELTNRANLQLRGVRSVPAVPAMEARPQAELSLTQRLLEDGLGPRMLHALPGGNDLRRIAVADDVRNLMLSATAGVDAGALYDTTTLADAILVRLENEPRFAALSPKFSILLDGGEHLAALDHPHDVWLSPMCAAGAAQPRFVFGFAGHPTTTAGGALAAIRAEDIPAFVHAVLCTFVDLATDDDKRMRDLLRVRCASDLAERAAAMAGVTLYRDADVDAWRRTPADTLRRFGAWAQRGDGGNGGGSSASSASSALWHVGAQAPLGRIDAPTLRALARLADAHASGTLRITPWQGVMFTDVPRHDVRTLEQALDALGLIRSPETPLGRLIACAGATGCAKALSDTKTDARELAARLHQGVEVHLSGCARSCAAAHCAPWTLLAVGPGRYDLYRQTASDTAQPTPGHRQPRLPDHKRFGERIATDMPLEAIALRLNLQDRIAQP